MKGNLCFWWCSTISNNEIKVRQIQNSQFHLSYVQVFMYIGIFEQTICCFRSP